MTALPWCIAAVAALLIAADYLRDRKRRGSHDATGLTSTEHRSWSGIQQDLERP